jgi:hypothetical protein
MVLHMFYFIFLVLRGGQPRVETLLKHGRSCRHVARYPKMEWQWRSIKRVDHPLQINKNSYGYARHALSTEISSSIPSFSAHSFGVSSFAPRFVKQILKHNQHMGHERSIVASGCESCYCNLFFLKWTNKEKDIYGWNGKKHQETIFCLVKTQQICGLGPFINTAKPRCFGYKFPLKWWNVP